MVLRGTCDSEDSLFGIRVPTSSVEYHGGSMQNQNFLCGQKGSTKVLLGAISS